MSSLKILGLDIGGANTKAALIISDQHKIIKSISSIEYFPFWEKNLNEIPKMLKRITKKVTQNHTKPKDIDFISIAITAELSDAFQTKREGIEIILDKLCKVYNKEKMVFINTDAKFITIDNAKKYYLTIAGSNWVSTALFLGNFIKNCILIDAGSTTIDLIPIVDSRPNCLGKMDIERIINHELIYTGGLRATIPSITQFVPYKGKNVRISFEKFALVSDVHRILNNISEDKYITDTADNRSKTIANCYARLSRMICMDPELISKEELNNIARFIYEKQLDIVASELSLFMESLNSRLPIFKNDPLFIITGLSADFLIKKALINLGFNKIKYFNIVTNTSDKISSSALAVAGAFYYTLQKDKNYGNKSSYL